MTPITKKQREIEKNRILTEMAYPWDQQPGEPDRAFALFLRYLAIGKTRNYVSVSRTSEIEYSSICKYANAYSWKIRSEKCDLAKDKEMMVKLDEEILQSRIRQQRIGKDMQELGARGINILNEYPEELSAADISKLIDVGVKIERLALNSSTEITESKVEVEGSLDVKIESVDPEIAAEIGKLIAIKKSEDTE